jgi:tRNA-2-methylthio-N6-dimethylallyladenosine synthase
MNVYDTRAIRDSLRGAGWSEVEDPAEADVLLMNTCAIREGAETRVLGRIGEFQRFKYVRPEVKIGVLGCMAQRLQNRLQEKKRAVDVVVGTDNYSNLPELLDRAQETGEPQVDCEPDGTVTYVAEPEVAPLNNSHFVSITQGCDYRCTFCVVPATRGILRHKSPEVILGEVRKIAERGGVELTLLGQNVTAYRHREASFAELVSEVASVEGIRRVRFLTSHPTDFPEQTIRAIADHEEIAPWLHMPVQSGSDRVLRRMKRGYRMRDYRAVVERARQLLPDVSFSTDIIVGFCGETDDDFRQTLAVMREVRFDSAFMFKYSERPDTPAARLADDVPEAVKDERLQEVIALQDEIWTRVAAGCIGEQWRVALEGEDVKGRGFLRGRTLNNRKVLVPHRADLGMGDELLVRITGCEGTTFRAEPGSVLWKYDHVAA